MLPGKIKLSRQDGCICLVEVDSEVGDNPELCRFNDDSDFTEDQVRLFFKAVVKLWNDQQG
jgi:hypothetical protein